jgi:GT2 family glycosyltransferase
MATILNRIRIKELSVSAVVPTYEDHGRNCLKSLPRWLEVIPVSTPGMSLAEKRNYGASLSTKDFLLFIDDDNQLERGSIYKLIQAMDALDIGVAGMLGVYHDRPGIVCDGGLYRHMYLGYCTDRQVNKKVTAVPAEVYDVDEVANVFCVRKAVFNELGGFDAARFPIDLDEADLCRRAKQLGYRVVIVPSARTRHQALIYRRLPDFRRPMNAYFTGRNKILFQYKHLTPLPRWIVVPPCFLMAIAYVFCLLLRGKLSMIPHYLKGFYDGLRNRTESPQRYKNFR